MKRMITAGEDRDWVVSVSFNGFIGSEQTYTVAASSAEEAEDLAVEEAADDLTTEDWVQTDDDEWEITLSFAGFIGVEETYTVYADDEDSAIEAAIEEAKWDLEAEVVDEDEFEDNEE